MSLLPAAVMVGRLRIAVWASIGIVLPLAAPQHSHAIASWSNRINESTPSWKVMQRYAARWNYELVLRQHNVTTYPPVWEKFPLVADLLNEESQFESVLWIDDDAFINRPRESLQSWLHEMSAEQDVTIGIEALQLPRGVAIVVEELGKEPQHRAKHKRGQRRDEQQDRDSVASPKNGREKVRELEV